MPRLITEKELKALAFVLAWMKIQVSDGVANMVPVAPDMRDNLIHTIRSQRKKIRQQNADMKRMIQR